MLLYKKIIIIKQFVVLILEAFFYVIFSLYVNSIAIN